MSVTQTGPGRHQKPATPSAFKPYGRLIRDKGETIVVELPSVWKHAGPHFHRLEGMESLVRPGLYPDTDPEDRHEHPAAASHWRLIERNVQSCLLQFGVFASLFEGLLQPGSDVMFSDAFAVGYAYRLYRLLDDALDEIQGAVRGCHASHIADQMAAETAGGK